MKILHFADAHIDIANYGRRDPVSGLPLRVLDFLKSLDEIIDSAVSEKVDLVIFAGDAYKDRSPAPTFQREWGKRIMRLSQARIPTVLLVGNHDVSPSIGRAHAIQEFDTLQVPYIHVISQPTFLGPDQLGIPVQVLGMPWVSRSGLMANLEMSAVNKEDVFSNVEERITTIINEWLAKADERLPIIFTAHTSVEGASYGGERTVMLGSDLVLSGSLVKNQRFDYVALGHIHKKQNLNEGAHPPVIYPGSIERVDFGEAQDDKFFVIADVTRGKTKLDWRQLKNIRPFIDCYINLETADDITKQLKAALPKPAKMKDAVVRLVVDYPRDFEKLIDENEVRHYADSAFEFHLVKRPAFEKRVRLAEGQTASSLSSAELLDLYLNSAHTSPEEISALQNLAKEILSGDSPEE